MTNPNKQEPISSASVVMVCEMLLAIAIIMGITIGVNVFKITETIANWIG